MSHAHLRLPAAWRHPVVRPDSDRQLLAHLPVSAEPAGAVSGCRYGPMRENPGLAATVPVAPPLSRRGLRSRHPGKRPPGCKGQRRFAHALSVVAAGPCSLPAGATHPYESLSPGADTATTCRTDCPG
uniref:YdaA n=1 Tax=Escherichia coli TaxID=562 RepID=I1WZU9_ECOLX|nr:YdaA [Escherichia coli]